MQTRTLVVAALVLSAAGLGLGASYLARSPQTVAAAADLGAPFTLVDHTGAPITEAALEGQTTLLFFGFTHCPEICPTTVYEIDGWMRALGDEAEKVDAYFVTVDPERDTPEILEDYLAYQSPHVTGITGDPEDVWAMARSWRVYWAKGEDLGGGNYNVDHTSSVYVLDASGDLAGVIGYGEPAERALETIRRAMG